MKSAHFVGFSGNVNQGEGRIYKLSHPTPHKMACPDLHEKNLIIDLWHVTVVRFFTSSLVGAGFTDEKGWPQLLDPLDPQAQFQFWFNDGDSDEVMLQRAGYFIM